MVVIFKHNVKMKTKFIFCLLLCCTTSMMMYGQFVQVGTYIYGNNNGDAFGKSVAISDDGNRIAVGCPSNSSTVIKGYVNVYQNNAGVWQLLGNRIDGEALDDLFGYDIAMSGNGNRIVVGAPNNDGNGNLSGHVRVLQFNGTQWVQLGADINGEFSSDKSGSSVSISNDGNIIAIGAPSNSSVTGQFSGHVRVYVWNGSAWIQRGTDINGEAAADRFGTSVSLSNDGSKLAVSATNNQGIFQGSGFGPSGHVRVYAYNNTNYVQRGQDIDGTPDTKFGISVSISDDGNKVAVGASLHDVPGRIDCGTARIFNYENSVWAEMRGLIGSANELLGTSLCLRGVGDYIVVGIPQYSNVLTTDRGAVKYLFFNTTFLDWENIIPLGNQFGPIGLNENDQLGLALDMTNDGRIVISGAPEASPKGYVTVDDFTTNLATLSAAAFDLDSIIKIHPNPTTNYFEISSQIVIESVQIYAVSGQLVKTFTRQEKYDIADLRKGNYFLKITSNKTVHNHKLIIN